MVKPSVYLFPAVILLVLVTLSAYRHVFLQFDEYLPLEGDWEYLWDDAKNFHSNSHLSRPAFTLQNIKWAWDDGEILGVWEPISLMIKMILHDVVDFTPEGVEEGEYSGPRRYRVLSAMWHTLNVVLAFFVGLSFVRSVNDYDYMKGRLKDEASGNIKQLLSRLRQHEVLTTLGLWLGTVIFAVHPLQAQTIGWSSCLSYIFSCTFSLLSFGGYVAHRDAMRKWRRYMRGTSGAQVVQAPFRILSSPPQSSPSGKGKKRSEKKGSRSAPEDEDETFLFTRPKMLSLVCYVCATLCKSPAVTLPLVFIIVDVFIYSFPLSSTTLAETKDADDKLKKAKSQQTNGKTGLSLYLPNSVANNFRHDAFPKLWSLTIRSITSWAPFLFTSFILTVFLIRGNSKSLLDKQTPFEKVEKSVWALSWYATKILYPSNLVAAVEKMSFSFLDQWEVAVSLITVPYVTLVVLANSTSSSVGRIVACAYGSFVAILLPSLGLIQHGRLFLAADRYIYLPLLISGPLLAALFGHLSSRSVAMASTDPTPMGFLFEGGQIPLDVATRSGAVDSFDVSQLQSRSMPREKGKGKQKSSTGMQGATPRVNGRAQFLLVALSLTLTVTIVLSVVKVTPETLLPWRNSKLLWTKNVEVFPDTENAHVNLAGVYTNYAKIDQDYDKALYHTEIALKMRPDSVKYKANIGILHARRNHMETAIKLLTEALKEHPMTRWSPLMHRTLGQCFKATGEFERAKEEFELAISKGEKSAQPDLKALMELMVDPENEVKRRASWKKKREQQAETS